MMNKIFSLNLLPVPFPSLPVSFQAPPPSSPSSKVVAGTGVEFANFIRRPSFRFALLCQGHLARNFSQKFGEFLPSSNPGNGKNGIEGGRGRSAP